MDCAITEIGASLYKGGEIIDTFGTYVDPEMPIPENITRLTGISAETVKGAPKAKEAVKAFLEFAGGRILVAHNANFDIGFIRKACEIHKIKFTNPYLDTLPLSRYINSDLNKHTLDSIGNYYNLGEFNHHRATDDTAMLGAIFSCMADRLRKQGIRNVEEMNMAMAANSRALNQMLSCGPCTWLRLIFPCSVTLAHPSATNPSTTRNCITGLITDTSSV